MKSLILILSALTIVSCSQKSSGIQKHKSAQAEPEIIPETLESVKLNPELLAQLEPKAPEEITAEQIRKRIDQRISHMKALDRERLAAFLESRAYKEQRFSQLESLEQAQELLALKQRIFEKLGGVAVAEGLSGVSYEEVYTFLLALEESSLESLKEKYDIDRIVIDDKNEVKARKDSRVYYAIFLHKDSTHEAIENFIQEKFESNKAYLAVSTILKRRIKNEETNADSFEAARDRYQIPVEIGAGTEVLQTGLEAKNPDTGEEMLEIFYDGRKFWTKKEELDKAL